MIITILLTINEKQSYYYSMQSETAAVIHQDPPPPTFGVFCEFRSCFNNFDSQTPNWGQILRETGGGGGKIGTLRNTKPKSTLLSDNTEGLITTKQTRLRPVASAAPITSVRGGGVNGGNIALHWRGCGSISIMNIGINSFLREERG